MTDAATLLALAIHRALGGGEPVTIMVDDGSTTVEVDAAYIVRTDAGAIAKLVVSVGGELYGVLIERAGGA